MAKGKKKKKTPVCEQKAAARPDPEAFVKSLGEYDGDEPCAPSRKKKKKGRAFNIVWAAVIAICAAALIYCIVLIADNIRDKIRGEEVYSEASELFDPESIFAPNGAGTEGDERPESVYELIKRSFEGGGADADEPSVVNMDEIRAKITSLKQKNEDVVGWIYIENTKISYPLMRSASGDDDYYLTHAFNGEYLSLGSIYMTSVCDVVLTNNFNTLIYGHNVVNGAMFHDLMKFLDPDFFNTPIVICTLDGVYVYQPFSIYETRYDYYYIQTDFNSEDEYLAYAAEMKSNSSIPSELSIGAGDTMITLSTCLGTGVSGPGRYALHAKLVEHYD
ncbi:MAG: class B sortase [Clostridia bacterium]|nr:class B sortase [Clostridia bacterium]